MTFPNDFDVVIVVAGGALATRMARDGFSVLMLERTLVHVDRIRGEFIAPWGVQEATQLGILDDLLAAGRKLYDEDIPLRDWRSDRDSGALPRPTSVRWSPVCVVP